MFFVETKYLNKFLWLWILIVVAIAFIFPGFGGYIKPYLIYLLMVLMFLSSLKIKFGSILKDFTRFEKVRSTLLHLMIIHVLTPILVIIFKPYISVESYIGFIGGLLLSAIFIESFRSSITAFCTFLISKSPVSLF